MSVEPVVANPPPNSPGSLVPPQGGKADNQLTVVQPRQLTKAEATSNLLNYYSVEGLESALHASGWSLAEDVELLMSVKRGQMEGVTPASRMKAYELLRSLLNDLLVKQGLLVKGTERRVDPDTGAEQTVTTTRLLSGLLGGSIDTLANGEGGPEETLPDDTH